ncbi:MAG: transposase family protein [Aestuariivirga sp.]|uniref:transposase family protein n=1 Tax=Aestuariivirga sp. TaxID=2650926 RepID=UPI00345B23D3|nr:transposase family protein [Aestuariivirga sp.]
MADGLRRRQDDHRAARPAHPSLRHHRNRRRRLAAQEPGLTRHPQGALRRSAALNGFSGIEDPRAGHCTYRLGDLIVLMVAGSLCGLETAVDMAHFAAMRRPVLNQRVPCRRAPSHDTFSRPSRLLDPQALASSAVDAVLA